MKTAACVAALTLPRSRVFDFVELTKPRIAVLVLFTVAAGVVLAGRGTPDLGLLVNTLCGTALVAAAASALNQLLERHSDALMRRTENRPLPAGRLQPAEVLVFGVILAIAGLGWLALTARHPLAVIVAAFTLVSYVCLYTPLKRHTTLNTLIGAVPGALPPVIGWTAITGTIDREIVALFLILFLWQVPHFLAIAWMYREDYGRAGICMLPVVEPDGRVTGQQIIAYTTMLLPVSLLPTVLGVSGKIYFVSALILGLLFLVSGIRAALSKTNKAARELLMASVFYLPLLFGVMVLNR